MLHCGDTLISFNISSTIVQASDVSETLCEDMWRKWIPIIFYIFALEGCHAELCQSITDPCSWGRFIDFPYMNTRHPSIGYTEATSDDTKYCDLFALNPGVWYASNYNMTTVPVKTESCGTKYPIWVNGSIPSVESGVVGRTACVSDYDSNCNEIFQLRMKNCFYYTVYCLEDIPSTCPLRYCFDVDLSKVTTTTTPGTTTSGLTVSVEDSKKSAKDYSPVSIILTCLLAVTVCTICLLAYVVVIMRKKLSTVHSPVESSMTELYPRNGCIPLTNVLPATDKV